MPNDERLAPTSSDEVIDLTEPRTIHSHDLSYFVIRKSNTGIVLCCAYDNAVCKDYEMGLREYTSLGSIVGHAVSHLRRVHGHR